MSHSLHDSTPALLPAAEAALRDLHSHIEELAAMAATAYPRRQPLRVETNNGWPRQIWYESDKFQVVSEDGSVGIAPGPRFDYHPDALFTTRADARSIAQALVSASMYVEKHPPADGGPN
ncbi:hypothetical protein ACNQR7_30875 [Mycolicibacterium senegalense]|uniref:hypothetical protein n=1 Tax=Mycolicibacterium senegalense TaxID=1796 RepID=UPI003AB0EFDC